MTSQIIFAILQIFGVFFVGWLARHWQYIREEELNRWSKFVIDFLFPLLVFHSIASDFDAGRLRELWPLPALGLGMIVAGALAGILLRKGLRQQPEPLVKTFHHFCAINNYGFLPLIIVQNLMGTPAIALLFFFNLGSNIGYWTVGVALLGESDLRKAARNIVNPSIIALFIALGLSLTGFKAYVPAVIMKITGSAGAAAIPCMLILIGASIYPFPRLLQAGPLAYLCVVRLAILPAAFVALITALPLAADVRRIALIVALMPASVSSTIITRRYGGDPDFAARAAVLTTILSIFTVPLGLWLVGG